MKHIFLHGLGQTNASWQAVQKNLKVEMDCPNLWELAGPSAGYQTLYEGFARWCGGSQEPCDLCGLSLGGILALDYAGHFPERVNSLVLISTPYEIPALLFGIQNLLFHLMPNRAFAGMGSSKERIIALTGSMKELEIPKMAEKVSCRTLILCGQRDKTSVKGGELLHQAIPGSRLQRIPGASHAVNEEDPEGLAKILHGFYGS